MTDSEYLRSMASQQAQSDMTIARLRAIADRIEAIDSALADACTLLDGWINYKCVPRYRDEHRRDVARKRSLLVNTNG